MSNHSAESCPQRSLENVAIFFGAFAVSQVGEYIGDTIHNPNVTDVPQGGVLAVGFVVASIATAIADRVIHRA